MEGGGRRPHMWGSKNKLAEIERLYFRISLCMTLFPYGLPTVGSMDC